MERVRQMNEKMNVLDVQLDNCTAKDAMKIIAEYMQTEAVRPYYEILRKKKLSLILKRLFDIVIP